MDNYQETHDQKLKRWEEERNEWLPRPSQANQELTQEQKARYWKERKLWGLDDL